MAQMRTAVGTNRLCSHHAVGAIDSLFNRPRQSALVEAGPTATGVELGAGIKQQGIATDAAVVALGPMVFVAAGESPLGGGMAGDFKGQRFSAFAGQQGSPFFRCFVGCGHEEQLMAMEDAQSGGNAA